MAVAKVIEIVASSKKSWDDAVEQGIKRATKTLKGVTGVELISQKIKMDNGKILEYRVHMHVTFILEK
jgi:flavin-binding protein dodecin